MSQYFDNVVLPSEIREFDTVVRDKKFKFKVDNGVFSKNKLDTGSRVLIEGVLLSGIYGNVLDLGCGYGALSIILSSFSSIDTFFDGVDVNKRAIHLANMNKKINKINNINFFESDVYSNITKKYDFIITNPPIRAGKSVIYEMLDNALNYLNKDGSLIFVMRKEHGAKSTYKHLEDMYDIKEIYKKNGFFVFRCNFKLTT